MSGFVSILIAILVFSVIILFHEFGHFLLARSFGVKVIEFSLGMGPAVLTWHGKETDYSLKALPFGGSCQMKGELSEDADGVTQFDDDDFNAKKPWQRFLIIAAGPVFNFILAYLCALVIVGNVGISRPVISDVIDGLPAQAAGMQAGDRILSIDGRKMNLYDEIRMYINLHSGQPLEIVYERDGERRSFTAVPVRSEETGAFLIGIMGNTVIEKPQNPLQLLQFGFYEVRYNIFMCLESIRYMISGRASLNDVMGPVGMVSTMGETVDESSHYGLGAMLLTVVNFIVLFSSNLGVMNLLPIPALDGGRILFIFAEMLTGRPVNRRLEAYVNLAGFLLLMGLMAVVMVHDIGRIGR